MNDLDLPPAAVQRLEDKKANLGGAEVPGRPPPTVKSSYKGALA